jgi:hypothetical protein
MQEIIKSKSFKIAAVITGSIIMALLIFTAGVNVGLHKARFSYNFGENYEKNFMGPHPEMDRNQGPMGMMGEGFRNFEGRNFRNPHGISGTIISISENSLVIKDKDNKESTVSVSEKTVIKSGRDDIKIGDLKTEDQIVIIGKPGDDGVIGADLIRIFDKNIGNNQNNTQQ